MVPLLVTQLSILISLLNSHLLLRVGTNNLIVEAELKQGRKGYEKEHAANTVETYALGHHTCRKRRMEAAADTR